MVERSQLIREMELLPVKYLQEIADFMEYLKLKNVPETMLLSEKSLSKYWDTPEEDEAWADL